jgi:hypothetical protein
MPVIGDDDEFESRYMDQLRAILGQHGVRLEYDKDRAGIDTGLHLFANGPTGRAATQARVWFQAKGLHATTLGLEQFQASDAVSTRVRADYLRYWYAAPEPVYLVVYVESADVFLAEDVRDIVDREWTRGTFYEAVAESRDSVTVHIQTSSTLDADLLHGMLAHRSMRIDGPAFRGRPLGHRLDPLRSQINPCTPELFERLTTALLRTHSFHETARQEMSADLHLITGRLYQTLEWQSPAFAEYGFGPDDDLRDEPPVETLYGDLLVIADATPERRALAPGERSAILQAIGDRPTGAGVALIFNGYELSGTGGLWRSTLRDSVTIPISLIGLESATSLVLIATLVYLEFAPELTWQVVNYQF